MKLKMTRSTGNVFRDVGFSGGKAEHLLVRADLLIKVQKVIESKHLTQGISKDATHYPAPGKRSTPRPDRPIQH